MDTERDRLFAVIFHGWVEVFTLFALLFITLTAWGWALNRRIPAGQRSGNTPWGILLISFALVLLLHAFDEAWPQALTIATSVLGFGLVDGRIGPRWIWVAAILLAALLGMGHTMSAFAVAIAGLVVFLFFRSGT